MNITKGGRPDGPDSTLCKSFFGRSKGLSNREGQPLSNMQITLVEAFNDTPFFMLPCVIIRRARPGEGLRI